MRALITGIGAISCLGRGLEVHRKAFSSGQSGLSPVERHWPGKALQSWVGLVSARKGARLNAEDMLCDAIGMALQESGLSGLGDLPVFAGSVHGEIGRWQRLRRAGDPGSAARAQWDFDLSRLDAVRKPIVISTACTASSVAIGEALRCLASGKSEIAIAAGTEVVSDFLYHGFESLRALAAGRCRPFDRDRDGLNLGEGAGAIVLETAASA
ncbi:hypothetical protein RA19_24850, partial [Leisingera sp. ANG-M1]|uniref:beta-ketoacyl synthase N-terminal-like domain-containing protein n=1 Tax=Leisingera sp. ANG-M1 TaxID=1577895 RepID=UPI00057CC1D7